MPPGADRRPRGFPTTRAPGDQKARRRSEAVRTPPRQRVPWRLRVLVVRPAFLAVLAVSVALVPGLLLANDAFSDVPTGAYYHDAVSRIKRSGITVGCAPTLYCPNDAVIRADMAVFLDRALGLAGTPAPGTLVE